MEMVPGLEERLLEGSDEGVVHVAELVSIYIEFGFSEGIFIVSRSRRVPQVRDRTTQRA
jgi:hypothetical protein